MWQGRSKKTLATGLVVMLVTAQALLVPPALAVAGGTIQQVSQTLASQSQSCTAGNGQPIPGIPWPGLATDLSRSWNLSRGGSVTVALLDTGVDTSGVPELAGQVTTVANVDSETAPGNQDCVGHGTFDAALIAGKQAQETGFSGVAPDARILSVAVTDSQGDLSPDTIAAGIRAAVGAGARIIVCGVASPIDSAGLDNAVEQALAAGALVVAPATLDGQTRSGPVYPAEAPGVLSVGDVGQDGTPTTGNTITGAHVDLVAPGDDITSAGLDGSAFAAAGASYATAFVAGAAALVVAYRGPSRPADLVRRLEATALHPGKSMPDPIVGYGVIDPEAAMTAVLPTYDAVPVMRQSRTVPLTVPPAPQHPGRSMAMMVAAIALGILVIAGFGLLAARARHGKPRSRVGVDAGDAGA